MWDAVVRLPVTTRCAGSTSGLATVELAPSRDRDVVDPGDGPRFDAEVVVRPRIVVEQMGPVRKYQLTDRVRVTRCRDRYKTSDGVSRRKKSMSPSLSSAPAAEDTMPIGVAVARVSPWSSAAAALDQMTCRT